MILALASGAIGGAVTAGLASKLAGSGDAWRLVKWGAIIGAAHGLIAAMVYAPKDK